MEEIQNTGVLRGRQPTDYLIGALAFETRNQSGDWEPYAPTGERQKGREDSMSCVSFSAINSIEMQEKLLTGKQPNYSDRWIAKMSETTQQGNYLWKVADAIRKYGLVLEEDYPTPANYTWDEYHAAIPAQKKAELIEKGRAWLAKWELAYEWLPVDAPTVRYHLKHAPVQIVIPNHAIAQIRNVGDLARIFDSYSPYLKNKKQSQITDAMKLVLTPKQMQTPFLANDKGTIYLITGNQDKRKIGIADLNSLGLFGDQEQIPMDTSGIPHYNTIENASKITKK